MKYVCSSCKKIVGVVYQHKGVYNCMACEFKQEYNKGNEENTIKKRNKPVKAVRVQKKGGKGKEAKKSSSKLVAKAGRQGNARPAKGKDKGMRGMRHGK